MDRRGERDRDLERDRSDTGLDGELFLSSSYRGDGDAIASEGSPGYFVY